MTGKQALYGGSRDMRLLVIRQRLRQGEGGHLRASEVAMLLDWAQTCTDGPKKADLLDLFEGIGGLKMMREAFGLMH
jgi:hypothetical protein